MQTYLSSTFDVRIGGKILIEESKYTINSGKKIVVLGKNGIGKTTLIEELRRRFDEMESKIDYLILQQDFIQVTGESVYNFLLRTNEKLYSLNFELESLTEKEEMTDDEFANYNSINEELNRSGWNKLDSEIKKIIKGFGFKSHTQLTSELSGGWLVRLTLARALLTKPQLLILDEPSNHLDFNAMAFLTKYLVNYPNAIILITHEPDLACEVADIIWGIDNIRSKGVETYTVNGNYEDYKNFREIENQNMRKAYDKYEKSLVQFKKTKPAKTRQQIVDFEKKNEVPREQRPYNVEIQWHQVAKYTRNVISMTNVMFSYSTNKIFENMNFNIDGDSRIALLGPNGVGKTTLFKLLSGDLSYNNTGESVIIKSNKAKVAYYHQQIIDNLPLDMSAIQYLQSLKPELNMGDCKAILGRLSLRGDHTTIKIENLSGGQKARTALAAIQITNPDVLLLDEPTNHLDIESIDALIDGINNFNGAVVVITHSSYLIRNLEGIRLYVVDKHKVSEYRDSLDSYIDSVTE